MQRQEISVPGPLKLEQKLTDSCRVMGTSHEDVWPGITAYPDYKPTFPKWSRDYNAPLCHNLDDAGLDLLEMMLVYDPAGRISAKSAVNHPYFEPFPHEQKELRKRTRDTHQ